MGVAGRAAARLSYHRPQRFAAMWQTSFALPQPRSGMWSCGHPAHLATRPFAQSPFEITATRVILRFAILPAHTSINHSPTSTSSPNGRVLQLSTTIAKAIADEGQRRRWRRTERSGMAAHTLATGRDWLQC